MTRFAILALSLAFLGSLALLAMTPPSAQLKARESGDCRHVEVQVDEGYGVSATTTQQICRY